MRLSPADIAVPPGLPGAARAAGPWRQRYWRLCRALEAARQARRLRRLRRRALAAPRHTPGCLALDGWRIHYDDLLTLYAEYRHICAWRIYDFEPACARPLVLDCGSHIGLSVLRFKRLAPEGRVIAFEPDAAALDLLRRNIAANGLTGVEVVPAAVGAGRGMAPFVADGADGGALAAGPYVPPAARPVPTVPLADYLAGPVDMLKLNVEGAEWDALRAAADRLHRVRQMVVEYHGLPAREQTLHEILRLLDACGFRYVLHHFDYETNPAARPPFRIDAATRFFTLVAARRIAAGRPAGQAAPRPPVAPEAAEQGPVAGLPALEPVSRVFGLDRGQPIDRHYIETFLAGHRGDIRGRVLEVGDSAYTRRFGGPQVQRCDVLSPRRTPETTVVADLTRPGSVAEAAYDCFILTQTLPFVYDVRGALRNAWRLLRPGGVLLLTVPGISQLSRYDAQRWGDWWRFTPQGVRRLLEEVFRPADVVVTSFGNLRAAAALLDGRAAHELRPQELSHMDEDYPVIVAARAVRAGA